ncbi:hypothetical protein ACFQZF_08025 [Flavobacterium myungsuense]|uniref:hypothetical protein n=1 Tax=Flavobacterium myungsuense TaxID=651823 RepID=UPI003624C9AD
MTTSCNSTIATGTVTLKLLPTVSLNSPSICPGETATLTATPSIAGTYTYEWEVPAGVTNPGNVASFTTTIAGTYTVTITNLTTSCKSTIATGTVTLKLLPTVSLNSPSICPGETATLTATPAIAGTYTYEWEVPSGVTNPGNVASFPTTIAGTYTVTITNLTTTCKSAIATGTVTLKLLPTVSLNSPSICPGETATLTATPAIAGTYTYEWEVPAGVTNPGNVASFTTTIEGAYTVTITNLTTSCKSAIATGTVTLKLLPTVSLNSPSICPGETATLTATPAIAGTYTYEWEVPAGVTNPGNVASFTTTIEGAYTVTITNLTTSCKSTSASGTVTLKPIPTASISTKTPTVCSGNPSRLDFEGTPLATVTYTENGVVKTIQLNTDGEAEVTVNQSSVYNLISVSYDDLPSCSQNLTGSVTITVLPLPTATISTKTPTVCSGNSARIDFEGTPLALVSYTIDGVTNTIQLDSDGEASLLATQNTTYTLVSVAYNTTPSCIQNLTASVTVTVLPIPTASISTKTPTVCSGNPSRLDFEGTPLATVTYTENGVVKTIQLNTDGEAEVTVNQSSVYNLISVSYDDLPSCSQNLTGSVTITVLPLPTATISTKTPTVCSGNSARIDFEGTPLALISYTLDGVTNTIPLDSDGEASLLANQNSTYTLVSVASSEAGSCTKLLTDSVTISINPTPTVIISSSGTACSGNAINVTFTGTPNTIVTFRINGGAIQNINIGSTGIALLNIILSATSTFKLESITLTNPPNCSQSLSEETIINVNQPPVAGSNANLSICSDAIPQDLFLFLGPNAQSGGTWSPALTSGTGFFDPKVDLEGSYIYTVAGTPPCVNDTALVTVTIIPAANAGSNGVANICSNSDTVDLKAFLVGSPQTGGTWSPPLTSGNGIFDPSTDLAGVYTYTVLGATSCTNAQQL